ncbi:lysoplasmalogenase [Caloramator sp. E03]|uniref:lysoplasmalogenase n=1 Tax=Caloramator sp. E03 TaxID=2576307 RepID=UPI00143CC52F|nr:lysoplasmalogenase [Caloramator sp. E03]
MDIFNIINDNKNKRYLSKSLLMPLLLLFYITYTKNLNYYVIFALIFSFLGDIFLLNDNKKNFMLGGASFLIGHTFYIISFIKEIEVHFKISLFHILLIVPYIIYGIYVYKTIIKNMKNLKITAILYMFIILFSSITCLLVILSGKQQLILSFLGTILFIVSDSLLGYSIFVHKNRYSDFLVMLTYVSAQTLLVFGFL